MQRSIARTWSYIVNVSTLPNIFQTCPNMFDHENMVNIKAGSRLTAILDFIKCEICHGSFLCETLYFVLYSWSSYISFFSSYVNITKLFKFKMPLYGHFEIVCSLKIRSLADIAEYICHFERRSDGNFVLKRTSEPNFFVSGRSN